MKTKNSALLLLLIVISIISSSCKKEDKNPPIITLIGNSTMDVQKGSPWVEPGYTAIDDVDGDISSKVRVTGSINMNVVGTYYQYYNVDDAAGNAASEVKRTIKVMIF